MKKVYTIERTLEGISLSRDNLEGLSIGFEEGLCIARQNPELDRSVAGYIKRVILPGIESESIKDGSDGGFDDRKFRYHNSSISSRQLNIALGMSHYGEYKAPFSRSREENRALAELGLRHFNDSSAFFPRAPGVSTIVITSDGGTVLGRRSVQIEAGSSDVYEGKLQTAGGHVDFREDLTKVNFEEDVIRELGEFGINRSHITDLIFTGLVSNPEVYGSDLDFTFLVLVNTPNEFFTSGRWRDSQTENEHSDLILIPTFAETRALLEKGFIPGSKKKKYEVIYSTRAALDSIRRNEMR